tara:strand:- start:957 stop:1325 length:369 start_codon:yes stop_codon:yes gene_type:complete
MKKILISLFLSLMACQANAAYHYDVLLQPNKTEVITNQMWWTLTGDCQIESSESLITLDITVNGVGSINGQKLSSGESVQVNAHNGESFELVADAGTKLKITKVESPDHSSNTQNAMAHCHL